MMQSQLPSSPASERNKQPILEVLHSWLGPTGQALEIASGTGQHIVHFAQSLPGWHWQPSDLDNTLFEAIRQRSAQAGLDRIFPPVLLDVRAPHWELPGPVAPVEADPQADPDTPAVPQFDLIYCANMLHIAPWECCAGLMQGAARHLAQDGLLVTYGPYLEDAIPTAPSNLAFDADLRRRDPDWGIRQLADVAREAEAAGLQLQQRVTMPANNLLLAFARQAPG